MKHPLLAIRTALELVWRTFESHQNKLTHQTCQWYRQPRQWLVQVCVVIFFLTRINLLDKRSSSFFLVSFLTHCLDFTFVIANISSDRALCKKVSKSESNFIVRFLNGWLDFFLPYVWYAWCTLGAHVSKAYQRIFLLTLSHSRTGSRTKNRSHQNFCDFTSKDSLR